MPTVLILRGFQALKKALTQKEQPYLILNTLELDHHYSGDETY